MKIFFVKEDSFLKIFKTLEKIPRGKEVEITIDPEHPLFDNEWRWKWIKDIIFKRSLDVTVVTQTEKAKEFFEKIWIKVKHTETNKFVKAVQMIYNFFFDIKKFHLDTIKNWKKYNTIMIFGLEWVFLAIIIYLIIWLLIPTAKITINPSQANETIIYNFRYYPASDTDYPRYSRFLSIPFYTGSLDYQYDLSINTANIKYLQNPSLWEVKIFNKTNEELKLVPNTRFITEDGKLFQTTSRITIPSAYEDVPWEVVVRLKAMEKDENEVLMWNRWNITKWTILYIRNLKQSYFLKEVYAVAMDDFSGGSLNSEWTITDNDIELLSWKLATYIEQQKWNIITQNFNIKDGILLSFNDMTDATINSIDIPYKSGQNSSILQWTVTSTINFKYINWQDIINAFSEYMEQRPSDKTQLISIDKSTLAFFTDDWIKENDGTYIVPTKIEVIEWYDFKKDINGLIDDIKAHIVSMNTEDARNYILQFAEIASTKIKVTPRRYWSIPKLKSRIKINTSTY